MSGSTKAEVAPLPAWVSGILAEPAGTKATLKNAEEKISNPHRHSFLMSLAGSLRAKGLHEAKIATVLLAVNRECCDPPKPENEVRKIAKDAGGYAPGRVNWATGNPAGGPVPVPGVLASDVKPELVKWLWANHVPLGKVTMFDGDPDEGKSLMSIDLAARVTKGERMPDGTECGCDAAGAVIVSLEDGVRDTIRPRLEAAGASLEKVRIVSTITGLDGVERTPTLPIDLPAIEAAILDVKAKLVVLDPVVGMLSLETNSYRDQDIRRVLAPTAQLAEKHGVAIICIRHLNKSGGQNAKYRGGGTIGIIGAARAAFLFADKPGHEGRYVFAPYKGNLWRGKPGSLEYSIEDRGGQPVIAWQGPSNHKATSLLAQPEGAEERNALADAETFLAGLLKAGPKDTSEVFQEARRARVSERTLYRAKGSLGVMSKKMGAGSWQWVLSNSATAVPKTANDDKLATFEQASDTKPFTSTDFPKIAKVGDVAVFGAPSGNLRSEPEDSEML